MPRKANELTQSPYLRMLLLGPVKLGKTTVAVATSPKPVYVINCDPDPESALNGAARRTAEFEFDVVRTWVDMKKAMREAADGVEAGKYKTIVLDPFSTFAERLIDTELARTDSGKGPDGRRAYPACEKKLNHCISFFLSLPCHFICVSHYMDIQGQEIEGQLEKVGQGIAPLLPGKNRVKIPAMFTNVVFMDIRKGKRVFQTAPQGVFGPGCRSLEGYHEIPASIRKLMRAFEAQAVTDRQPKQESE